MKKLLASMFIAAGLLTTPAMAEEKKPETKRVCIKTTDAKTQKEVEKCRVVKIHEKHEGTPVPEKAPKK